MKRTSLSLSAWTYVWAIFGLSLSLVYLTLPQEPVTHDQWLIFSLLTALACTTQFMEARFGRQTYTPHLVPFYAGVVLLPSFLFVLLVMTPHIAEWIHKRLTKSDYLPDWYIQPFNITTHVIAGIVVQVIIAVPSLFGSVAGIPADIIASLIGILVYILINHYLIGQVLLLARGLTWTESRMWSIEVLIPDAAMLAAGYVVAELWGFSPWLILPALAPLGLMFQAMKVPQLQQEARTDAKTGLLNARHFRERFDEEIQLAARFNRPLAVIMADLDLLRDINNTYGHLAGDVVIAGVAGIIREESRDFDIAARFGGEEYALVLPNTNQDAALVLAQRIRERVEKMPFCVNSSNVAIHASISVGVAVMPQNGEEADDLIHEADVALYQAKYRGRNRVVAASDVPHSFRVEYNNRLKPESGEEIENGDVSQEAADAAAGQLERDSFRFNGRHTDAAPALRSSTLQAASLTRPEGTHSPQNGDYHAAAEEGNRDRLERRLEDRLDSRGEKQTRREGDRSEAGKQTAATPAPASEHRLLIPYVVAVICGGLFTAVWSFWSLDSLPLFTLLVLGGLAVAAESLNVTMYARTSVSASATVALAALLLAGMPGIVFTASAIAIMHYIRQRPQLYKAVFNWSIHVMTGILPSIFFSTITIDFSPMYTPLWVAACAIAIIPYYFVETGLIAIAIGLNTGEKVQDVWREHFGWLILHYIMMSVLSVFMVLAYDALGLWGLAGFVLPVFLVHQTQKMYVERTERSVAELHRMNDELKAANREIARAGVDLQQLNEELLEMLAKIIDARDPETSGHALRVADHALALGRHFNLSPQQMESLRWAGMLHDIGKLGVPERILLKPSALTTEEYAQVKKHAALGGALLETVHGLRHLAPFVRHHHERWDGKGYPAGLAGEEIPLEARILAVCDATEAMASARPYKTAFSLAQIVEELRRCAGSQFDPEVAHALIQELSRKPRVTAQSGAPEAATHKADNPAANTLDLNQLWQPS